MRIQQNSGFLIDFLRQAGQGELVPAAFQRPYVWSKADVEAFWTSLLRKWPTGSLLIWEPDSSVDMGKVARSRLGPIQPDGTPSGVILDGQNRLATFAWSMRLPGSPLPDLDLLSDAERETWANGDILVLDPDAKAARFMPEEQVYGDRLVMPAGLVIDPASYWPFIRKRVNEANLKDDVVDPAINWLETAANALRDARCSAVVIERATPDEALEAFRHIARTGVPMSEQDFEAAMSWAFEDAGSPKL